MRVKFTGKDPLQHAQAIDSSSRSLATSQESPLEILYWSPTDDNEEEIYQQMRRMYEDIHTYKDEELYGQAYQPAEEVLTFDQKRKVDDLFQMIKQNSSE